MLNTANTTNTANTANTLQKHIKIISHNTKSDQNWFGTTKDSQIFFSDGFYSVKDTFKLYKNNRFNSDIFEIGNNGGSYSLNFNKSDLEKIISILPKEYEIKYFDKHGFSAKEISKEIYLTSKIHNSVDEFTEWLIINGL